MNNNSHDGVNLYQNQFPMFTVANSSSYNDIDFSVLSECFFDDELSLPNLPDGKSNKSDSTVDMSDNEDISSSDENDSKKRKGNEEASKSQDQVDRRRERNRVLARKTRLRKKFYFESLQKQVAQLSTENDALKQVLTQRISNKMRIAQLESVPTTCSDLPNIDVATSGLSVISHNPEVATSILGKSDFSLMKAIQAAQRSFVITDPSLPDNPIIFASKGFLDMCGYRLEEVLGRNCRFLQGPDTDPEQIQTLRNGVIKGDDTSVCLLNYKADGTRFYNQIFVAALRDANNVVINYVGVQVEVEMTKSENVAVSSRKAKVGFASTPQSIIGKAMNKSSSVAAKKSSRKDLSSGSTSSGGSSTA